MEEMRVYVANLGKYNEGELVGDWFEPPIDYDEMAERIGLNEFYEEYAIHDYELPFEIDEYTPIEEVKDHGDEDSGIYLCKGRRQHNGRL